MKTLIIFLTTTLLGTMAHAKIDKADWELTQGKLVYHVHYPLKNVEGIATNVKGKGHCENGKCEFLIAAPLKDFKSGDGNRDNHMLEVTRAAQNPMVVAKVTFPQSADTKAIDARAEISFAGKTHVYEHISLSATANGTNTVTAGKIPLRLSEFAVERPSLLAVKIDDAAPIDFELTWK